MRGDRSLVSATVRASTVRGATNDVVGRVGPPGQRRDAVGRELLFRPLVLVGFPAQAQVQGEPAVQLPRVVDPQRLVVDVVDAGDRRVVDVDLRRLAVGVAIEDVERLIAEQAAAIALDVVADLEVVAALPAVLEVRQADVALRLPPLLILVAVVGAAVVDLAGGGVDAAGAPRAVVEVVVADRAQREEVPPVADQHVEERPAAEHAGPLGLHRGVLRRLVVGGRQRRGRADAALVLQLLPAVDEADHLVVAAELERGLERPRVGQLRALDVARQAQGVLVLVVQPVAVEGPRPAAPQRAADVAVEVVLLLDLVAAGERRAREEAVLVGRVRRSCR